MGKSYQGIIGNWSGKTGNVVARKDNGRTIYAVYQPIVNNPRTDGQVVQRKKVSLVTKLGSRIAAFIQLMFANLDGYERGSWLSAFVGFNLKHAMDDPLHPLFTVSGTDVTLNSDGLMVSPMTMNLAGLKEISAAADSGDVNITWGYSPSDGDGGRADDIVSVLMTCDTKRAVYMDLNVGARSAEHASVTPPADWAGEETNLYVVVRSADGEKFSATWYKMIAM